MFDAIKPMFFLKKKNERYKIVELWKWNRIILSVYVFLDLVPRENVEAWLKHLRNEFPTVAFKASTQTQTKNLVRKNVEMVN